MFLIHVVFAVITTALAFIGVEESRNEHSTHLDVAGIATLSLSVFCGAFYITQGPDLGFTSPAGFAIIALAVLSFLAFILAETRSAYPMFDFSVFKIRFFSGALLGAMGMNFSFWPFMIYLPLFFESALGYGNIIAGLALLAYTLPTLIIPPLGERILLRFGAGTAIPLGLAVIGLGFILMYTGSVVAHPGWLTLLPGCLFAGAGLGLTNTTVTNTTTGAVASHRAGMASGIDMSARMISLAMNIALMGFILITGILSSLKSHYPAAADASLLRRLAEKVAGGTALPSDFPASVAMPAAQTAIHEALMHGFRLVMLYGGVSAWILALLSVFIFGGKTCSALPESSET